MSNTPLFEYSPEYKHSHLLPLKKISWYGDFDKSLGSGTFANVDKYSGSNGSFAIKKFHIHELDNNILMEISVLKMLDHPNIIPIIDFVSKGNINAIVLPIAVTSVGRLVIHDYKKYHNVHADHIGYQMLCSVAYIHSRDVLHRDIKPDNFLYFSDGTVKLSDFGTAKPFSCIPNNLQEEIYTITYRPPEILMGKFTTYYGKPADIWALAVSIWVVYVGLGGLFLINKPNNTDKFANIEDQTVKQIRTTIAIYGTPSEKDWEYLDKNLLPTDMLNYPPDYDYFTKYLPKTEISEILLSMLKYNPENRKTAQEVLRSTYFDNIRDLTLEVEDEHCVASIYKRDRYIKPYTSNNITNEMRSNLMDQLAKINLTNRNHLKTYLLTNALLDFVTVSFDPIQENYNLMGVSCLSLASYTTGNDPKDYFSDTPYGTDSIETMNLIITKELNFDLIFTTSYDYFQDWESYSMNYEQWSLAKGCMIITALDDIRNKLLNRDIFYICIGISLWYHTVPIPKHIAELLSQYNIKNMVRVLVKNHEGIVRYFNKITNNKPNLETLNEALDKTGNSIL